MPSKIPTVECRVTYDRETNSVRFGPPRTVPTEPESSGLEKTVAEIRGRGFEPIIASEVTYEMEPATRRPKPVEVIDDFCRRLRTGLTTAHDADWIEKEWAARLGRVQLVSEAVPEPLVDVLVIIACDENECGWSFDMAFRRLDGTWLLTGAEVRIAPVAWLHFPPIPQWFLRLMDNEGERHANDNG